MARGIYLAFIVLLCNSSGAQNSEVLVVSNTAVTQPPITQRQPESPQGIYLPPPSAEDEKRQDDGDTGTLISVSSSLAIVLGLFGGLVWLSRKTGRSESNKLPADAFDVLGHCQLDARHKVTMVRCGRRILLLSTGQGDLQVISELSNTDEIAELSAITSGESSQSFGEVIQELSQKPSGSAFIDAEPPTEKRRRLFAHDA